MRQKNLYLARAHLGRVTLVKMQNEAFNPVRIGLLGTDAVMLEANLART